MNNTTIIINKKRKEHEKREFEKMETEKRKFINAFDSKHGFAEMKPTAIKLLQTVCKVLDEFNVQYCLIAGTLLGYIRHNDFIPWDDDIDLLVDFKINDVIEDIVLKYNDIFTFILKDKYASKICFKNGLEIKCPSWEKYIVNNGRYTFPFIDLCVFNVTDSNTIMFYDKPWNLSEIMPFKKTTFLDISVYIPNNPEYFLKLNYGEKYMTELKSSNYCHRKEHGIFDIETINYADYKFIYPFN